MAEHTPRCILCENPLTGANDSAEHVIPEAIGGRKEVRGFICRTCNNAAGADWDRDLANQMEHMSLLFSIKRSRGSVRPAVLATASGHEVLYQPDGSMTPKDPAYAKTSSGDGVTIQIRARSKREARRMLKRIARKYPKVNVEAALARATIERIELKERLIFKPPQGGVRFWRSAVKSMLALTTLAGGTAAACEEAVRFLRRQAHPVPIGYFYTQDVIANRPEGVPLHVVHVMAREDSGVALGYIEYFGFFRAVSCLGSAYRGPAFRATYAIDPRTGNQLELNVDLSGFTQADIAEAYNWKKYDADTFRDAMGRVVGPTVEAAHLRARAGIITDAMSQAMRDFGIEMGTTPTDDEYRRFSERVSTLIAAELVKRGLIR